MPGMVSDHNAVVGALVIDGNALSLPAWQTTTGQDTSSFVTTEAALFASPDTGDLSLRAGSPAIDRGDPDGAPPVDVRGTTRPQGAGFDLGAYEYCDGSCTGSGSGSGDPGDSGSASGGSGDNGPAGGTHSGGCGAADPGPLAALFIALAMGACLRRRSSDQRRDETRPSRG